MNRIQEEEQNYVPEFHCCQTLTHLILFIL